MNEMNLRGVCMNDKILLEYYRKKYKLSYESLLYNSSENTRICSVKTYKNIIQGHEVRHSDKIIMELYDRINKTRVSNVQVDYSRLSTLIEYEDEKKIRKELECLLEYMETYKDNALYDCHYNGINIIYQFYKFREYPLKEVTLEYLSIKDLLDETLVSLLMIIFSYAYCMGIYYIDYTKVYGFEPRHLLMKLNCFVHYIDVKNEGKAYAISTEIDKLIKEDNYLLKIRYYPSKIYLYRKMELDYKTVEDELNGILMDGDLDISNKNRNIALANQAIYSILRKEYETALYNLMKMEEVEEKRKQQVELYILFCKTHLGLEIDYEKNILATDKVIVGATSDLYNYFLNTQIKLSVKNKGLHRIAKKHLEKTDSLYLFIIEEELYRNCSLLKCYKDYYDFREIKSSILNKKY